jgi:CRP-like cAMP-binding protein
MQTSSQVEDPHAEVRAIIEGGFAKLQSWLDTRLERLEKQDDFLRKISLAIDLPSSPSIESSLSAKDTTGLQNEKAPEKPVVAWGNKKAKSIPDNSAKAGDEKGSSPRAELGDGKYPDLPGSLPPVPPELGDSNVEAEGPSRRDEKPKEVEQVSNAELATSRSGELEEDPDEDDWQTRLMQIFSELDQDQSGSVDQHELMEAFEAVGLPEVTAFETLRQIDKTGNGSIDHLEWFHIIDEASRGSEEEVGEVLEFLRRIEEKKRSTGQVIQNTRRRKPWLILRHDSLVRMNWDLLMMLFLVYISLAMPYTLGFGEPKSMETLGYVLDTFFCGDILLNFRTSYVNPENDTIIFSGAAIAKKYLKTWFLIDFFSSVPFDLITAGLLPSFQPMRLLKLGKVAKVMKLLRINNMLKSLGGMEFAEKMEEQATGKALQTAIRVGKLAGMALICAHWLACFGAAVDDRKTIMSYFIDGNGKEDDPTDFQQYLAAVYYAMTTLSTVGYGDVIPATDMSRLYAMLAMVLGGAFYGYIIGSVTSVICETDANHKVYYERMDLIQSWLDRNDKVPKMLRRRIRKHFKQALSANTAIEDSDVIAQLSPELRDDTVFFIVDDHVRSNSMFRKIPNSALASIVVILKKVFNNAEECIVKQGDPGIAMFILVRGTARYAKGSKWMPDTEESVQQVRRMSSTMGVKRALYKPNVSEINPGNSFGEEILFGFREDYSYTIVSQSECCFHTISEDDFQDHFKNMPDLRDRMLANFMQSRAGKKEDGRPSLEAKQVAE